MQTNTMTKEVYASSTPIKLNIDPVSKNSASTASVRMNYERIYHGIYLTSIEELCSPDDLRIYGFTHIIYIDKHIIENNGLGAPAHLAQMAMENKSPNVNSGKCYQPIAHSTYPDAPMMMECHAQSVFNVPLCRASISASISTVAAAELPPCSPHAHEMQLDELFIRQSSLTRHVDSLSQSDFEILDLNFGETAYLTTVLPNCYKAVKFIEQALKHNGAVLVIDCIGGNQKCVTIVVGFLMYKYNKNFLNAYQLIKRLHPNIELDKFFTTQLYEYEPILKVQRRQLAGNSCSRELRSTLLKRKKSYDDGYHADTVPIRAMGYVDNFTDTIDQTTDILMEH